MSKKTFGKCLPFTLMAATFSVYFSQMFFRTFYAGLFFLTALTILGMFLLILKRKDLSFISNIFSYGLFTFIAIFFLFFIIDFRRSFSTWDELSHWGVMVKEMLRLDRFYSDAASSLIVHKEYPPFVAVFEMIWCMVSGGYSEAKVTMSLHIFSVVLLISYISDDCSSLKRKEAYKQFIKGLLLALNFVFLILSFDCYNIFNTIYTDLFMPILYVYCIMLIINKTAIQSKFGFLCFCTGMSALILSKQMSISFVMLAYAFFFISYLGEKSSLVLCEKIKNRKASNTIAILTIPPALVSFNYYLWGNYISSLDISGQFDLNQINIGTIFEILLGGGTDIQHETFEKYFSALFSWDLFDGIFRMTYVSSLFVALLMIIVIYYFNKNYCSRKMALEISALFIVGSIGYAFTMFVLYMFCYSDSEMLQLASYARYMDSYIVSEFLILFSWLIYLVRQKRPSYINCKNLLIIFMVFTVVLSPAKLVCLMPQLIQGEPLHTYREQAEMLQNKTYEEAKILVISNNNVQNIYYLNYYLSNRKMDTRYLYENISQVDAEDSEYWTDIIECIEENDFIYIIDASENVTLKLTSFTDSNEIKDRTIYQVKRDGEIFELIEL